MSILKNGSLKDYKFQHNGVNLKAAYHNGTVLLWQAIKYIFNNGATSEYTGGWSVESEYPSLSVGSTIFAEIDSGGEEEGTNRTAWITSSKVIDFSGFNTITITGVNWILADGGSCDIAYYIGNTCIKTFSGARLSGAVETFTANISNINSGKLRVRLHIEDGSDYYSSNASVRIRSIMLS